MKIQICLAILEIIRMVSNTKMTKNTLLHMVMI